MDSEKALFIVATEVHLYRVDVVPGFGPLFGHDLGPRDEAINIPVVPVQAEIFSPGVKVGSDRPHLP